MPSENEKLRALLAEARKVVQGVLRAANSTPYAQWSCDQHRAEIVREAIDAALAEPVAECARCETLRDLADKAAWAQGDAQRRMIKAQQERDEARAEVERLKRFVREESMPVARAIAYKAGAEAMREAAAQDCIDLWGKGHLSGVLQAERIRALPLPEDKS
jgi:hypothetical protein